MIKKSMEKVGLGVIFDMDGADNLIIDLYEAGTLLSIGSSAPMENIRAVMSATHRDIYFKVITDASEVNRGKPDPEIFLKTAGKMELPPERCAVVEDAHAGVRAGRSAGCAVIALTGTATREQLEEADLIADSLRELTPDIFKSLLI